jgi:hypothetical protein
LRRKIASIFARNHAMASHCRAEHEGVPPTDRERKELSFLHPLAGRNDPYYFLIETMRQGDHQGDIP